MHEEAPDCQTFRLLSGGLSPNFHGENFITQTDSDSGYTCDTCSSTHGETEPGRECVRVRTTAFFRNVCRAGRKVPNVSTKAVRHIEHS